jgi:hypothetical protein
MKKIAGSALVATLLALLLSAVAHATSSLSFEGGGYWLDLEIGHTDQPVIASVSFHAPGDQQGVVLRTGLGVETFDTKRKELLLVYEGSDSVPPFTLSVHGEKATLETGSERVSSTFNWEM